MNNQAEPVFGVSDFVAVFNQTLEYAYPSVAIVGELANLRMSKKRWVYFDLKDDVSSVKFFGTAQQLPGPLEEGMLLQVRGVPRLHNLYGFSINVQFMQLVGEGSIKKAAELLQAKLSTEGLFELSRKRALPLIPRKVGLITSAESAAYKDFIKILDARWRGVEILLADVQVQGEPAVGQIIAALNYFNEHGNDVDVVVLTRGGGSADDLAVFSTEQVTRAVAASRVPTLVAIGHEVDVSLAELAADRRASTPSNAAEMLVPDRHDVLRHLHGAKKNMMQQLELAVDAKRQSHVRLLSEVEKSCRQILYSEQQQLVARQKLLAVLDPQAALRRGYAVIRKAGAVVRSTQQLQVADDISVQLVDGIINAKITGR